MCEQDGELQNYLNYEIIMTSRLSLLLGQLGPYKVSYIFPFFSVFAFEFFWIPFLMVKLNVINQKACLN